MLDAGPQSLNDAVAVDDYDVAERSFQDELQRAIQLSLLSDVKIFSFDIFLQAFRANFWAG